jgi:pyridinium-3,5-biscarboxylic acid mononucleotide sulfurtransferase
MNSLNDPAYRLLIGTLQAYKSMAVAFSGGVDSSFLLAAAKEALGDQVLALTVRSSYMSVTEIDDSVSIAKSLGVRHKIIDVDFPELIRFNPPDRCYHCKKALFTRLLEETRKEGVAILADGSNADDPNDYRPGFKALRELEICSPILESGITKAEVRRFSNLLGLPTADKPALACLLTRIPYGTEIKSEELNRIEKAENFLHSLGHLAVRVRTHDKLARIETSPEQLHKFLDPDISEKITRYFREIGYTFVTIDLEGYKTGGIQATAPKKNENDT